MLRRRQSYHLFLKAPSFSSETALPYPDLLSQDSSTWFCGLFFSQGGIKNTLSVNSETHTSYLYSSIYYIEIIWVLYFQLNS